MSHQPFETWIFESDHLAQDEQDSLQAHLESCARCKQMQHKWQLAYHELHALPEVRPAPGFTQRWQASLVERRARDQRKQAWTAFLWFMGGAMVILLGLAMYTVSVSTPAQWLAVVIRYGSNLVNFFNGGISLIRLWIASTPLAINLALWIYLTITLCLLSLAWVFALWRTSIIGVLNK